jgi:hypothetical protein
MKTPIVLLLLLIVPALAFVVPTVPLTHGMSSTATQPTSITRSSLFSTNGGSGGDNNNNKKDKLQQLGFSSQELERSRPRNVPPQKVQVNLVNDVDPFTLTAIGFGLIAFNFLIFANMGDAGLSGLVATLINKLNE